MRGRSLQGPRAVEPRHRRLVGENGVRRIRGKRKLLEWGVEALGANAFGECSVESVKGRGGSSSGKCSERLQCHLNILTFILAGKRPKRLSLSSDAKL